MKNRLSNHKISLRTGTLFLLGFLLSVTAMVGPNDTSAAGTQELRARRSQQSTQTASPTPARPVASPQTAPARPS
ncbi:MAG TPA: hypothetical protein VFD48_16185, partial [Pyrinomonadaceae bacterium]|nr:hypothetical protein [Pyrinomonadaceae bacterium]